MWKIGARNRGLESQYISVRRSPPWTARDLDSGMMFFPFLTGMMCFIPIVWFVISILLCVWVYRDAESRGMSGPLWVLIMLIGGIIGLIVYLIVRKEKKSETPVEETRVV